MVGVDDQAEQERKIAESIRKIKNKNSKTEKIFIAIVTGLVLISIIISGIRLSGVLNFHLPNFEKKYALNPESIKYKQLINSNDIIHFGDRIVKINMSKKNGTTIYFMLQNINFKTETFHIDRIECLDDNLIFMINNILYSKNMKLKSKEKEVYFVQFKPEYFKNAKGTTLTCDIFINTVSKNYGGTSLMVILENQNQTNTTENKIEKNK